MCTVLLDDRGYVALLKLAEMDWAQEMTDSDEKRLSLMVWLKCCQRLGRFPRLAEIPAQVIEHVRNGLGLPEQVGMMDVAEGGAPFQDRPFRGRGADDRRRRGRGRGLSRKRRPGH
ncbi:DUF4158 domain-containing protein [Nonomuraea sp. CA-141351]|uniref:DUF4158 domain-containing protein n=1 Tax=Nonomuraea sp. CA-141351 TaxID=3239996 RepID=UPI003D8CB991